MRALHASVAPTLALRQLGFDRLRSANMADNEGALPFFHRPYSAQLSVLVRQESWQQPVSACRQCCRSPQAAKQPSRSVPCGAPINSSSNARIAFSSSMAGQKLKASQHSGRAERAAALLVSAVKDGAVLDRKLRVAVIGGGPSGACTAETLAKGGIETFLIERKLDNCKVGDKISAHLSFVAGVWLRELMSCLCFTQCVTRSSL